MAEMIKQILTLSQLGLLSLQDVRKKEVSVFLLLLLTGTGAVFAFSGLDPENLQAWGMTLAAVLIPGFLMLLFSRLPGGRIGAADGWVVMALGLVSMDFGILMNSLMYGMLFCGAAGLFLLVRGKKGKKDTVPFIPFLSAGYLAELILQNI